ncbi:MAG: cell division protein FtsZ [Calditrichaeota bacterium]|nr:cell division protein FtsZ [Calditrichota bacterium]
MKAKIKEVGVGGAGGNAINRMIEDNLMGVEFIAVNSDAQDLDNNLAEVKIQIGKSLTKGLGAGADTDIGRRAVDEDHEFVEKALSGADMVFITAGMGGGTGSGAAPRIARIARELSTLTVGIVTRPFVFEGRHRAQRAEVGIEELRQYCDTSLVIPNETLLRITDPDTTFTDALRLADSILHQATRGISDLINIHGLINLDFADVRTIMLNMGDAIMGTGIGCGEERAILAAQQAISSPLLQNCNIQGARGLLVNVTGDPSMTLHEVNDATSIINEEAGTDANVIFGAVIDPNLSDEFRVTVIATGFNLPQDELPAGVGVAGTVPAQARPFGIRDRRAREPFFSLRRRAPKDGESMAVVDGEEEELMVFGDDLEVPTILRSQASSRVGSQPSV